MATQMATHVWTWTTPNSKTWALGAHVPTPRATLIPLPLRGTQGASIGTGRRAAIASNGLIQLNLNCGSRWRNVFAALSLSHQLARPMGFFGAGGNALFVGTRNPEGEAPMRRSIQNSNARSRPRNLGAIAILISNNIPTHQPFWDITLTGMITTLVLPILLILACPELSRSKSK